MTLKEIADIAGVSPSTVSKVINHKDDSISAETREHILRIVREYNYVPYASSQASQKTMILGLLLGSSTAPVGAVSGFLTAAQDNGYSTIIRNSLDSPQQEYKNITALCRNRVDAVVWEPLGEESLAHLHCFAENHIPCFTVGAGSPDAGLTPPFGQLGAALAEALLSRGHRKIACLVRDTLWIDAFLTGCRQHLFSHKLRLDDGMVFREIGDALLYKISSRQITGMIISDEALARQFCRRMHRVHIAIPEDLSVVTLTRNSLQPSVSCCVLEDFDYGAAVCRYLMDSIENREPAPLKFSFSVTGGETLAPPPGERSSRILVIGSINIDTYLDVSSLPHQGMAVSTNTSTVSPGGKGINQAVGAALMGHRVSLIGSVGFDPQSDRIFDLLHRHRIDASAVGRSRDVGTGKAYIFVDNSGNSIVSILAGANHILTPEHIRRSAALFEDAAFCLIQTEIPIPVVLAACRMAHRHHVRTIVKPSACAALPGELLPEIDILCPNEDELAVLCPQKDTVEERAACLQQAGIRTVIATLGERGCYVKTDTWEEWVPAADFLTVDTTGASDAFISVLASYLLDGYPLEKAVKIAVVAAGFSVSRKGVVSALIDRASLEAFIRRDHPELMEP